MSYQIPKTSPDQQQAHICVNELYKRVNQSLQGWGKHDHVCYDVFQPVVQMELAIVEEVANGNNIHREQAVWKLLRKGIAKLEPSFLDFNPDVMQALQQLRYTNQWPHKVPVPPECRAYVALRFIYVSKTKNSTQVATFLDVPIRTFYKIRSRAIREIVQRLLAWNNTAR